MNKRYHPLTLEQRYPIGSLRDSGKGLRGIAERVGVNHSTVSRELKRNSGMDGYSPTVADQLCQTRKRSAHKARKRTAGMGDDDRKASAGRVTGVD